MQDLGEKSDGETIGGSSSLQNQDAQRNSASLQGLSADSVLLDPLTSSKKTKKKPKNIITANEPTVAWLKAELKTRDGFEEFERSHHRVLQNPTIIKHWRFMYDFRAKYYHSYHESV